MDVAEDELPQRTYSASEEFKPVMFVGRESLPVAIRHGMELWWDGSTPTHRLDQRGGGDGFTRFVNARIEGKLAEVAFSDLLWDYFRIDSTVDWRIYGEYEITDDGDLQYLVGFDGEQYSMAVDLDIKKTKPYNQWLCVRENIFESISDDAPIVLAKHQIEDDIDISPWSDSTSWEEDVDGDEEFRDRLLGFAEDNFPLRVEFSGMAYKSEFTDFFERGERLYDATSGNAIGPKLRRDNHGINVAYLDDSPLAWNRAVEDIIGDNPIDWNPLAITKDRPVD